LGERSHVTVTLPLMIHNSLEFGRVGEDSRAIRWCKGGRNRGEAEVKTESEGIGNMRVSSQKSSICEKPTPDSGVEWGDSIRASAPKGISELREPGFRNRNIRGGWRG
jgi:hypothetical protein